MDEQELLNIRMAQNNLDWALKQENTRYFKPTIYDGYNASTQRAIISGVPQELITNGFIKNGQNVAIKGKFIDALPKVRKTFQPPIQNIAAKVDCKILYEVSKKPFYVYIIIDVSGSMDRETPSIYKAIEELKKIFLDTGLFPNEEMLKERFIVEQQADECWLSWFQPRHQTKHSAVMIAFINESSSYDWQEGWQGELNQVTSFNPTNTYLEDYKVFTEKYQEYYENFLGIVYCVNPPLGTAMPTQLERAFNGVGNYPDNLREFGVDYEIINFYDPQVYYAFINNSIKKIFKDESIDFNTFYDIHYFLSTNRNDDFQEVFKIKSKENTGDKRFVVLDNLGFSPEDLLLGVKIGIANPMHYSFLYDFNKIIILDKRKESNSFLFPTSPPIDLIQDSWRHAYVWQGYYELKPWMTFPPLDLKTSWNQGLSRVREKYYEITLEQELTVGKLSDLLLTQSVAFSREQDDAKAMIVEFDSQTGDRIGSKVLPVNFTLPQFQFNKEFADKGWKVEDKTLIIKPVAISIYYKK